MALRQNDLLMSSHNYWVKIVDFLMRAYFLSKSKLAFPSL